MSLLKKKKFLIPFVLVLILAGIRVLLEPVLLGQINKRLADFSPEITGEVADLDLSILRGVIELEDIHLKLREVDHRFLIIEDVEVDLAWSKLFDGDLLADAMVEGVYFTYDVRLPDAIKKSLPPSDPDAPKTQPPVRISRLDWRNVNVVYPSNKAFTNEGPFKLSEIEGRVTNLFGEEETPRSFFNVRGKGSGTSNFKAAGSLNLLADPLEWDVDAQLQGFNLVSMNQFLYQEVPITFQKGTFDLYAEAKSEEGKIRGYAKPFFQDLAFIRSDEDFKGAKHWLLEVAAAVGNWILEAKRSKTVATKVPFTFDGENFSVNTDKAIGNVIEHGFDQEISPGVDASMRLEAQEAQREAEETKRENETKEEE